MRYLPLVLCFFMSPAWADFAVTYAIKEGGNLTLTYRDDSQIRLQVSEENFMLMADGKVWSVNRDGNGWTAMDMSAMGDMMRGFGMSGIPGMGGETPDADGGMDVTFRNTGRTETVAGYQGSVYQITDDSGDSWEVVLTDHEDVTAASRAFMSFSDVMAQTMGMEGFNPGEAMEAVADHVETGLLRQDDNMTLISIDTGSQPDSMFNLPAGTRVQSMPSMPAMPQGMPEGFSFPR